MSRQFSADVADLRSRVVGDVIEPGEPEYDEARTVWNGMFDRRPRLVVRPTDVESVAAAVSFARDHELLLAVKGGGHNSAGTGVCDGGLVIDLARMRGVSVEADGRRVRVQGGALLGDVDRATEPFGTAVPSGIVSHTGVGGLTLGGGFGWISRTHGFSIDNLRRATVATSAGGIVTASAEQNPDLFWAIRGGGGNFGVVTDFEFEAASIGRAVYAGLIVKAFADAPAYLRFYRDYVRGLPDQMTVWAVIRTAPPLPFLDASVHGQLVVVVPFVYLGEPDEGARLIEPLRKVTPSVGEMIDMIPWAAWQTSFDQLVAHGARNYWKSHHLTGLPDACIDRIVEHASALPTGECEVFIGHMEGKPSRVPQDATAFAHRTTPFQMNLHTRWRRIDDDARCIAWARTFHDATREFARGVYVNFITEGGADAVREAYTPEVWQRLQEVKRAWDPQNVFRVNQNITPAAARHA